MNCPPTDFDFDYNTITVAQGWPWLKGTLLILVGCVMASMLDPFGPFLEPTKVAMDYQI